MKSLEIIFSIFNTLILPQWVLMIFAPRWKWTLWLVNSYLIPIAIGIAYAFLAFPNLFGSGQMPDFGTLDGIKNLFKIGNDEVVVGGWFHYLAFDLLVGSWILTDSQKNSIKHWFVVPCLFFTLMTGPVGFVLYQIIKLISQKAQKQA